MDGESTAEMIGEKQNHSSPVSRQQHSREAARSRFMHKQQAALASLYHRLQWCKVAVAVEAVEQRRV
jgi:hypothetical protein